MKKVRKLASLLLALVMVMSLGVMASAASGSATLTITQVTSDSQNYVAYQIFSGTVSGNTLSDVKWGDGVDSTTLVSALKNNATLSSYFQNESYTAEQVADILADHNSDSSFVQAFAACVKASLSSTTSGSGTYSSAASTYTISGLADGYYFVYDTGASQGEYDANSSYMLQVLTGTENTVVTKEEVPTPTKSVGSAGTLGASYSVGDDITFILTGTIPSSSALSSYETYTYIFHDTLSDNLDYKELVSVTASTSGTLDSDAYTLVASGQSFELTLNNAKSYVGQTITVTYKATLTAYNANGEQAYNDVYIEFSNDPSGTTGYTPEKKTYVYAFDVVVNKVGDDGTTPLEGAAFTLFKKVTASDVTDKTQHTSGTTYSVNEYEIDSSGNYWLVVGTSTAGTETSFTFGDQGTGDYKLSETTTPSGYNTVADVEFAINATYAADGQINGLTSTLTGAVITNYTTVTGTIQNNSGSSLPNTGGMGTTAFYIIGGLLVFGAVVILITRRRMRAE